ncbi:pterin 4 alpha carbinolamine dehydratase [Aspergillus fumigatus]|nr:pterin 4 alpha carbinolamine dehydratase [Aspergillus fumigatus]
MDAARGVLQRRVRACISRPRVLSGRVIYPSLWLSSSLSSLSSSVRARSSPRTTVSPLRGGALREGRGLLTPVMAGAGVGYSTTTGASGEQEQEQEKAQEQEQEQEPEKAQEQEQEQEPEKAQEQELEQGQEPEKPQVQISQGEDAEQVQGGLERLLENGWVLDGERMGIKKTFYFRSYFKAVSFLNVVASQSATKKHHPTMTVRIGSVDVHWTTHNPRGLSSKDIAMAEHCEEGAQLMGAVDEAKGKKCSLPAVTLLGTPTREREHEA